MTLPKMIVKMTFDLVINGILKYEVFLGLDPMKTEKK